MVARQVAVLALTAASVVSASTSQAPGPNILTVVVDDLGWSDVGYHDDTFSTPTIDGLAKAGIALNRFYTSPTCTPSRTQFITGKYNIRLGMQDSVIHATEPRGLPLDEETIANKISAKGYQTAAIGKWHLGMHMPEYLPLSRGFDRHYWIYTGGGSHTKHLSVSQSIYVRDSSEEIVYTGYNLFENGTLSADNYGNTHSTHLYAGKAIEFVESFDTSAPFFLYLAFQAIHDPIEVGNPAYISDTSCNDISSEGYEHSATDYDERKTLCGMMAEVDDGLNNIVLSLKAKGLYDNTAIIFFSDNGGVQAHGSVNLPLRGAKGNYWEGGVRVPAFLSGGFVQSALAQNSVAPYVYKHLVHLTDMHATIAGLAGIVPDSAQTLDGIDLSESLLTGGTDESSAVRSELLININSELFGGSGALIMRSGQHLYKLIVSPEPEESAIYNTVRKAIATSSSDPDNVVAIIDETLTKKLGKVRTRQLFDISLNEGEREGGDCSEAAECSSLVANDDYSDVLALLEARWAELSNEAAPTSFAFEDDGALANPGLFGGAWDYWRVAGSGEPRAAYGPIPRGDSASSADTSVSAFAAKIMSAVAKPSTDASDSSFSAMGSLALVSAFLAGFGGLVGVVAFNAGKRYMDYMPI
jgi:arylsulfatase I/J